VTAARPAHPSPPSAVAAPAGRRARHAARTRAAITAAARRLFDERGYDHTTVEQIADAAEVAPRTVFRYFPTKESILFAELDVVRQELLDRFDRATAADDAGRDPLRTLFDVLDASADLVEDRLEQLSWGFRVAEEHAASRAYAETTLRAATFGPLVDRLAVRLGVDPATDPRPEAWATVALTLFGAAVKAAAQDPSGRTKVRSTFRRLRSETGAAMAPTSSRRSG
jgi:AcrR family transcriptional regulator